MICRAAINSHIEAITFFAMICKINITTIIVMLAVVPEEEIVKKRSAIYVEENCVGTLKVIVYWLSF